MRSTVLLITAAVALTGMALAPAWTVLPAAAILAAAFSLEKLRELLRRLPELPLAGPGAGQLTPVPIPVRADEPRRRG